MRRGDIWTIGGGKDHAGKPRPAVIVQDDSFDATDSIMVCAFTTDETDAPLFRLRVEPNERNGLRAACLLMVDKITTVPKSKVRARVGRLEDEDILRLNRAVLVFLGLAVSPRGRQEASRADFSLVSQDMTYDRQRRTLDISAQATRRRLAGRDVQAEPRRTACMGPEYPRPHG